jgi:prepilin signal peptidase PulO-like enzyme (type II secretory pathway)
MNRIFLLLSAAPHPVLTALSAMAIAGVAAFLGKRTRRERVYHAGYLFAGCIASVLAGSWIMYLIHG